jgi:predicted outer membrane repeat protein
MSWTRTAVIAVAVLTMQGRAHAAVLVVNDTADLARHPAAAPCVCASTSATCTLRAAIQTANACTGAHTIQLAPAATYVLSIAGALEDAGATGDHDITLQGAGSTIDAQFLDRVLDVRGASSTVILRDLTLRNGTTPSAAVGGSDGGGCIRGQSAELVLENVSLRFCSTDRGGGAILADGVRLEIVDSFIASNTAEREGGALRATGGTTEISGSRIGFNSSSIGGGLFLDNIYATGVVITNTEIYANTSDTQGGAIATSGSLTIRSSNIHHNYASDGAGIYCNPRIDPSYASRTAIYDTTFADNLADESGGGIYSKDGGTLEIWRSLFRDNWADDGGGIYSMQAPHIVSSTFAENTAHHAGGAIYTERGLDANNITVAWNSAPTTGGIYAESAGPVALFENSIVAHNDNGGCHHAHSSGWSTSASSSCLGNSSDILTSSTGLGTLADHGGPTQTIDLSASSPAVDSGHPASCASRDQRSILRDNHCDMGAYERL